MPLIQPQQLDITRGHRLATAGNLQKQQQQMQMGTYEMQRQAHLRNTLEKDFDNYLKFGTFENRVQFAQHIGSKGAVELAGFLRNMSKEDWDKWKAVSLPEVEEELISMTIGDKEYTDIVKGGPQHLKLKAMEGAFRGKVKTKELKKVEYPTYAYTGTDPGLQGQERTPTSKAENETLLFDPDWQRYKVTKEAEKVKPKLVTHTATKDDPYGFPIGTFYQVDPATNKPTRLTAEPKADTKITLTKKALAGDVEAKLILDEIVKQSEITAEASATGKLAGLHKAMDLEGSAKAILEGRETIENVRNTFGVPIQEIVRKKVLAVEPDFNFVQPRAIYASLKSSITQQQKNRGMMGSFVKNINKQVDKLDEISSDIVKRVGIRALDMPKREFITRFIGSGHEAVFKAYMKEVSAEIAKLAQGSAASIAQLPEENRKEWERIHDVNLSMKEILIVLRGTREMANIRLQSVEDEIQATEVRLEDVRARKKKPPVKEKPIGELTDDELMERLTSAD